MPQFFSVVWSTSRNMVTMKWMAEKIACFQGMGNLNAIGQCSDQSMFLIQPRLSSSSLRTKNGIQSETAISFKKKQPQPCGQILFFYGNGQSVRTSVRTFSTPSFLCTTSSILMDWWVLEMSCAYQSLSFHLFSLY